MEKDLTKKKLLSKIDPTPHINQFQHNLEFHDGICKTYPDNFYDWKITLIFYCSYHLVKALAAHRNVDIGDTHSKILWNLNPKNSQRKIQFKNDAFYAFDLLFEYSQTARYKGFTNMKDFQILKKADYEDAIKKYNYLKSYIESQGVTIVLTKTS